jgi:hypothetical protein
MLLCARCGDLLDDNGLRICTDCLNDLPDYGDVSRVIDDFARWLAGDDRGSYGWGNEP